MRIGLDFGGVVELRPAAYGRVIQDLKMEGHEIFLVSHAHNEKDGQKRADFAHMTGISNHTFWDIMDEREIRERKVQIVRDLGIDLFVEDGMDRLVEIAKVGCACIYVPQSRPDLGAILLQGLCGGWR